MSFIAFLDGVYILAGVATIVLLLCCLKKTNLQITRLIPLLALISVQVIYGIILFIEWDEISLTLEHYEDLIGALIPMFWLFVFYALIQFLNNLDIKTSEQRMQLAIKGTQAGLWDWMLDDNTLIVNDRWIDMLGYTPEELAPVSLATWNNLTHPDDLANSNQLIASHIAGEIEFYECDIRMRHKDGSWIWVNDRGAVVEWNEQGKALRMTGTHIDITEKKKNLLELEKHRSHLEALVKERTDELETVIEELRAINDEVFTKNLKINEQNSELQIAFKNLRESQTQLLQAEKMASLGILTAGVAHEINNPLNFIIGGCLGLENHLNSDEIVVPSRIALFLDSINTGVNRVSDIVKSLSQFSSKRDNYDEICDIGVIVDNCLVILQSQIQDRIIIEKNYALNTAFVHGKSSDLHQAIISILHNSVQSITEKGVVTINLVNYTNNTQIEIIDTGCGIKKEHLSHLTDPFYTTRDPGAGVGLGLSLTYAIIKAHNGRIDFESEPNKGTTVKIVLPKERVSPD